MRLVGESGLRKRPVEEISGAVSGEHAAGAVAAVGGRRKPQNEQPGGRIAEARQWPPPVFLIAVHPSLLSCHFAAVGDQTRAASAVDDFLLERFKRFRRRLPHEKQNITMPLQKAVELWS